MMKTYLPKFSERNRRDPELFSGTDDRFYDDSDHGLFLLAEQM